MAGGTLCLGNAWESAEWDPLQTWLPLPISLCLLCPWRLASPGLDWFQAVGGSRRR